LRRTRDLASLCLAFILLAPQAIAQPWQRLPDGRVVIEVKDHKLAFDPDIWGASGTSATVDFVIDHEHERHSLAEVIEAPDRFRPIFANEDAVGVRMSNSWDGPGLFLNRFDRRSVPTSTRIEMLIFDRKLTSSRDCNPRHFYRGLLNTYCSEKELYRYETESPDADGFWRVVSPSAAARAASVQYVLSDVIRKTYAPGPVTFGCRLNYGPVPSEWGRCHSYSSYTGDIGIYYEFEFLNYPEATWVELDRRMRQIYAGILVK
jgi:hypothetical protein